MKLESYARVSTVSQKDNVSREDQEALILRYAQAYGHEVSTHSDVASGANKNREGFNEAFSKVFTYSCRDCVMPGRHFESIAAFETKCSVCSGAIRYGIPCKVKHGKTEGKSDGIIVAYLDRLARDLSHFLLILEQFHKSELRLILLDLNLDTTSATGMFTAQIFGSLAEFQRKQSREKSMSAVKHLRSQGLYAAGGPRFGKRAVFAYHAGVKVSEHRLEDDERESAIVSKIRKMYFRGRNFSQIAAELNQSGEKTKKGAQFTQKQVQRILVYEGVIPKRGAC